MRLIEKQREFALHLGWLLTRGLWKLQETYPTAWLRLAEGYVGDSIDKPGEESPHRRDGGHFKRLAQDLTLDINGDTITSSAHAAWRILQDYWSSLHPDNQSGGAADMNHFGRYDGGVA